MAVERDKTKTAQQKAKEKQERLEKLELATATALLDKGVSIQDIAKIMDIIVKRVDWENKD
ncbi:MULTISPECIES: hypothetical protein [unclassified Gilliamella]|uniref:hypothetical protein n=1 Tax=unclassified Gilliamella TaxID=2685620 RepID=UPI00226AE75E|nr:MULTISPECIES: hypothetical protein [unclassified Gilliamella]MCX8597454.1 hypothetical protein [Gilliamella sp. B3493]MCX8599763.1 hypothetical protein [Gilliamella sp. B3486]MCX8690038.1 hypothetical protein [Gilliamella sp. B2973]MCX8705745.1 hypothetical protein [Gilliamella sp. B3127]